MLNGRLRVAGCGGSLVVSEEEPCCCEKCGCTNPYAPNYDPEAQLDDGSCRTCCNQGLCVIDDDDAGANCNSLGGGASKQGHFGTCCDAFCLTAGDCSYSFDESFTPEKFCPGTEEFTYHDCYSCPSETDEPSGPTGPLELKQILESRAPEPHLSAEERLKRTRLPKTVTEPFDPAGPGTTLSRMFSLFGIHATPRCICSLRAYVMDVMGCWWCVQNILLITRWLEQEARRRKLPYARFLGAGAVLCAVAVSSLCGLLFKKRLQYG